jgi:hypothetical protein
MTSSSGLPIPTLVAEIDARVVAGDRDTKRGEISIHVAAELIKMPKDDQDWVIKVCLHDAAEPTKKKRAALQVEASDLTTRYSTGEIILLIRLLIESFADAPDSESVTENELPSVAPIPATPIGRRLAA